MASASPQAIVCGAGAIGACTAYFLAQKGLHVTVVEKCDVACAASGKAGGFLALDWCDGGPVAQLARASFRLHEQLAEEVGGSRNYGYRRLDTVSVSMDEPRSVTRPFDRKSIPALPSWIDGPVNRSRPIGSKETTAQVHPQFFTRAIMSAAIEKYGVKLVIGEAEEIEVEEGENGPRTIGVVVNGNCLLAEIVVLAMGPWSANNRLISSLATISGLKAHSIVLQPRHADLISGHALFLAYRSREGRSLEPEVYPRPTGEVYICGMSEEVEIPKHPNQVMPTNDSISVLHRVARTVSSHLEGAEVKAEQACILPYSEDGVPLIGKIPGVKGAYVATGHSCWGILNAPATGASLAELVVDGESKLVDLKPFEPGRFRERLTRRTTPV
eukprot:c22516_g2_i1 orf=373-1530(-)